ncbi:TetR/AcrR family transcriptional regulator [Mesorhizobium caraganae]|uniref:TetR/AcrR family transcriptional regulator n=1 Tax=Mesorhizobium caraganae TaxID=483206 RepID=UPI003ECED086
MNQIEDITTTDPRRVRILDGALKVFLAYGFSRTTMDDIARAADMSRPALYLLFKNKTDIFRAIAMMILSRSVEAAKMALARDGTFAERATQAIDEALISMMRTVIASPHGAELLDMKSSLADLVGCWRDGLGAHIGMAIENEARRNGTDLAAKGLSARLLADMLLDGLEGMKARISDPDEQRTAAAALVKVIDLALQA